MRGVLEQQRAGVVGDLQQLVELGRVARVVDGRNHCRAAPITAAAAAAGSMLPVSGLTSAKRTVAPCSAAVAAVATNVSGVVTTSSPALDARAPRRRGAARRFRRRPRRRPANPRPRGDRLLELARHRGPDGQPLAAERGDDRLDVRIVDRLTAVGDRHSVHRPRAASRMSSASSHRSLVSERYAKPSGSGSPLGSGEAPARRSSAARRTGRRCAGCAARRPRRSSPRAASRPGGCPSRRSRDPGATASTRSTIFMLGMRGTYSSPPCIWSKESMTNCTAWGSVIQNRVIRVSVIGSGLPSRGELPEERDRPSRGCPSRCRSGRR